MEILQRVGATISSELDLQKVVQAATDAGRELSGAEFGAFFYNVVDSKGESYMLYTLSGAPVEAFNKFPLPRNTAVFAPTFVGEGTVRIADVRADSRYGHNPPYNGMPQGHLPVRSYLAVPVISRSGEVLGGLFYGHGKTNIFTERAERLVEGVAKQAAIAIDNARLYDKAQQEIEERRKAEEALKEATAQSQLLAAIVESSDDVIVSKDLNGIVTSWNKSAERTFGYRADEVIGKPITIIIPPELIADEDMILSKIRAGEKIDHFETVRVTKIGERLNVSVTISPIRDNDGRIIGAAKILRDITQQRKMEDVLRRTEKLAATGRLAATMAHEINNPLESITNLLYLVLKEDSLSPRSRKNLELADQELDRIAHVARQTLGFYRDTSNPSLLRVADVVNDIAKVYNYKFVNRAITLEKSLDENAKIHASAGEFRQVFSNLLINGVDAISGEGGKIAVRVRRVNHSSKGAGVRIVVADSGCGIAGSDISKLFDAFFTTKREVGTGLGLWLTQTIMEKYGGNIQVRSRLNRGTVFSLFWPSGLSSGNGVDES